MPSISAPYTSSFAARQMAETAMDAFLLPRCSKRFPQEIGKGRPLPERPYRQVHGGVQRQDQLRDL